MKYNLNTIATVIEDVTGITLERMRQKISYSEVVEARHLFILIALEYGIYTNKDELTIFINQTRTAYNYAKKKRFMLTNLIKASETFLIKIKESKMDDLSSSLNMYNYNERIELINSMVCKIPREMHNQIKL